MAFEKRTWLARIGAGLNKFIIGAKDGEGKQTLTNSPDSVTQIGDVISAENLNDLEDRIEDGFDDAHTELVTGLGTKQNTLTFDNVPTQNSNNPVKSGGVYATFQGMKLTKIWENPSPTSAFNAQQFVINSEGNDIVIEYVISTSSTLNRFMKWIPSSQIPQNNPISSRLDYSFAQTSMSINSRIVSVGFYSGEYQIGFEDAYIASLIINNNNVSYASIGKDNSRMIPLIIYRVGNIYS